jgi:hypothetical protein
MAELICKYCGRPLRAMAGVLRSDYGPNCPSSPNKKHMLVPNPPYCIYCGEKAKPLGSTLVTSRGQTCPSSPNKKHIMG